MKKHPLHACLLENADYPLATNVLHLMSVTSPFPIRDIRGGYMLKPAGQGS